MNKIIKWWMSLLKVFCLFFLSLSSTSKAQPATITSSGVSRVSLGNIGITVHKNWVAVFSDTVLEEETNYYSSVYNVGTSTDAEKNRKLFIVSTTFSGADKGENASEPLRYYLLESDKKLYFCGNREKKNGLGGASPIFRSISKRLGCEMQPQSNVIIKELEILTAIKQPGGKTLYWVPSEVMVGVPGIQC